MKSLNIVLRENDKIMKEVTFVENETDYVAYLKYIVDFLVV